MVLVGFAVTLAPVVPLSPVAGLHEYVVAPDALSVVELPAHIEAEFTVIGGKGFTVTVQVVVPVQPPLPAVSVYVVVLAGLAVTVAPLVELNPVAGLQV